MTDYELTDDGNIRVQKKNARSEYVFDGDVYEPVTRAVGTQREVANRWARGELPVHEVKGDIHAELRTTTGNYKAFQYPDGTGRTQHYAVTNAIRTRHGEFLLNSQDYAKGWATLTYPSADVTGPRSTLDLSARVPFSFYDIKEVTVGKYHGSDGFMGLVEVEPMDGNVQYYRANRDEWDDEPLPPHQIDAFLDDINTA